MGKSKERRKAGSRKEMTKVWKIVKRERVNKKEQERTQKGTTDGWGGMEGK